MPEPPPEPQRIVLLDENLIPQVAQALLLIGYECYAATEIFPQGTDDPTIIHWLGMSQAIWVTTDERAKREHASDIQQAGISILFVHRPKEGMSAKSQLLLLLWVLDQVLEETARARGPAQFQASYSGKRPKLKRIL